MKSASLAVTESSISMMYGLILAAFVAQAAGQNTFTVPNWSGNFAAYSGVLESMKPASDASFDFSPSDFFALRNGVGNHHTGDFSLRWRREGQSGWSSFDTAELRDTNPVNSEPEGSLLRSDFANVLPASDSGKLLIQRDWLRVDSDLVLQVSVSVPANATTVEIGSLGFPIEFNSIFSNRTADEVTAKCSLIDPYVGQGAGYVQVTRLTGTGPNLVITPYGNESKLEGWRFLSEPSTEPLYYQSQIFEGFYSWEMFTEAYAQQEWNATEPWNIPTSSTLRPGESIKLGLRFTPTQNVYDIESTVASVGKPVAVGLPGYVLPHDVNGQLFLQYDSAVTSISASPAGTLEFTPSSIPSTNWQSFAINVNQNAFGRVLVTVKYADGLQQTIHYFVTQSQPATASSLADFAFEKAYLEDESDPFNRYGLVTFDSIANAQVLQDPRVWIAGIADEAGSFYEALSAKEAVIPDAAHVLKLEKMVKISIWGHLQNSDYSVKRSLFFYQPDAVPDYKYSPNISWGGSWNKADAYSTWRAYDFVHVSSIYYYLYRAERVSPGILTINSASWYLQQAYKTVVASQNNTGYADVGLMGETMWVRLVNDLQNEGFSDASQQILDIMKGRQKRWASQSNPFGSEMAWDSTGQEGVYAWSRYFNDTATMTKTLDSIRGYMPTVAHWGWNGNARRYWDFLYGGKLTRIERMIHHYGSSLNAIPLLDNFRHLQHPASPAAFYDLRVGFAGNMGPLSNINAAGMPSTAFHSWSDTMAWDGYSGDYGPTYLGHILGSCTYLVQHPEFGWVAMGGNINSISPITVKPVDTVRRCLYIADMGLMVEIDAGQISSFTYAPQDRRLTVNVVQSTLGAGKAAQNAIMTYESTLGHNIELLTKDPKESKGGIVVKLPGSVVFQS